MVISQCRYARADPAVATPALASVVQNRDRTAMCHSERTASALSHQLFNTIGQPSSACW